MYSAKIPFFLTISAVFLQYTSQEKQIRGSAEVDYPTYYVIPKTSFRCSDQLYNPGFYADTETRCQVFHYCYENRQESFLCPMGTIFNQPILTCDYWYSSNCSLATSYYHVNANRRNEDQFDDSNDSVNLPSENLFDKMAHLYEKNETPKSSATENVSDDSENEFLEREDFEFSDESSIEKNNKTEDHSTYNYDNEFTMVDEEHPEVVKYEVTGLNTLNIRESSDKEQLYETENVKDFIFLEDGMLHQSQDVIDQMHPTDMNFNQEYSDYVEIPKGKINYDWNDEFDPESEFQTSDFELQKRYAETNGGYLRRPSNRKPIIIIPEEEPEIVQLPVVKYKRKPIGKPTFDTNEDSKYYETDYDSSIKDVSVSNEAIESATSDEFSFDGPNSDLNVFELREPNLFYENQEDINDENNSQLHQADSLNAINDYSNIEQTLNENILSSIDENEILPDVLESREDSIGVSNAEYQSAIMDSKYGDDLKTFFGNSKDSTVLPLEEEGSLVSDQFLGSGSEDVNHPHSSDGISFPEDQYIYSDGEDAEITDSKSSYLLPNNLFDTSEGSGISMQVTTGMANFNEFNKPIQFGKESSFSSDNFENFLPLESSDDNAEQELEPDGSGESNGFDYFPHELQESSDNPEDALDKTVPEIREIDGSYYIFSDSEHHSNYEYDDSSVINTENMDYALAENEDIFDETTEESADNEESSYSSEDSELKMDQIEDDSQHELDYQGSRDLEDTYEELSDELEVEASSELPEEDMVEDSDRELSTEDLKYLEIMSQNPSTMMGNLFDVSTSVKSSSNEEKPHMEIVTPEQDINEQVAVHEDSTNAVEEYEFESLVSNTTSGIEENSSDIKFSENSEILNAEQFEEDVSNEVGSTEDGPDVFSFEQKIEAVVPGKEADPFNPLFAESNEMLLENPNKKKLNLKAPAAQPKNTTASPVLGKERKKVAKGKSSNENLRTFNPPNQGKPSIAPSGETFREALFTSIPSTFLKMKHSTLRPNFLDYDLKKSGLNPRTGDLLQSSKLSKLTSLGRKLLAAKSAKFNRMKRYIDSYRS